VIEDMATLHISEAELARDLHAVLEQVRQGGEVVVEQDDRPGAIMKPAVASTRTMSEVIRATEASGHAESSTKTSRAMCIKVDGTVTSRE
jgi:antitoxin (DNA-binding transcriptional repressor) of toxin-antitoxin stability system